MTKGLQQRSRRRGAVAVLGALALAAGLPLPPAGAAELEAAVEGRRTPWTHLRVSDAEQDFRFVVVSDRTGEHREGVFREALRKTQLLEPAFVLSVGDLIEGYTEDRRVLEAQWRELRAMTEGLSMPFFYAAGNHDMSNRVMARAWQERFGPTYYHFRYKDVLFLVLNSELFGMALEPREPLPSEESLDAQLAHAESALAEHGDVRFTFVVVHQPLWDREEPHEAWQRIEGWLAGRPHMVFAGHKHKYTLHRRQDSRYITLGSTGGHSELRGIDHGEFDHVLLVTMRGDRPVLANLMLEGIHGEAVRTADTRSRVESLMGAIAVQSSEPGVMRFAVSNETGEPLLLRGRFSASPDLRPETHGLKRTLSPGARESLTVALDASAPLASAQPALASWRLTGARADGTPLVVEREAWLLPNEPLPCPEVSAPVQVNGNLEEWGELPIAVTARPPVPHGGSLHESRVRYRFGVRHDDSYLYVGVDVEDETRAFSEAHTVRQQDAVMIEIDARSDPARSSVTSGDSTAAIRSLRHLISAWITLATPRPDPVFSLVLPPLPDGSRQAAARTPSGYAVELAIPSPELDERQGRPWEAVRVHVTVYDARMPGDPFPVPSAWRPGRLGIGRAPLPIPGSGTFLRE